jgi:hypothetical protein
MRHEDALSSQPAAAHWPTPMKRWLVSPRRQPQTTSSAETSTPVTAPSKAATRSAQSKGLTLWT